MNKNHENERQLFQVFADKCREIRGDWSGFTYFTLFESGNISLSYSFDVENMKNDFVVFKNENDFHYDNFETAFQHFLLLGFVQANE
jgi:hypothetical protein